MERPKVFIIYDKKRTKTLALDLYYALEEIGVRPWIDQKNLYLGVPWKQAIEKELPTSDAVVVLLHPGFEATGYRLNEVTQALEAMKNRLGRGFLIPFIVEPCKIPQWCEDLHAGQPEERASTFEELIHAIQHICDSQLQVQKSSRILATEYTSNQYGPLLYNLICTSPIAQELSISIGKGDFVEQLLFRLFDEQESKGSTIDSISHVEILCLDENFTKKLEEQDALETDFLSKMKLHVNSVFKKLQHRHIPCDILSVSDIPNFHGWMYGEHAFIGNWTRNADGFWQVNTPLLYHNGVRQAEGVKKFRQLFRHHKN